MDFMFLQDLPLSRMLIGQYLGVMFIPFTLLGYWWVSRALRPAGQKIPNVVFVFMVWIMFIGVAYHACIPLLAKIMQGTNPQEDLAAVRLFIEPLGTILAVGFFSLTLYFSWLILKGKTYYQKWLMAFNPIFIYVLCILLYIFIPSIGNILLVTGFNLSNAIFLMASLWAIKNNEMKLALS